MKIPAHRICEAVSRPNIRQKFVALETELEIRELNSEDAPIVLKWNPSVEFFKFPRNSAEKLTASYLESISCLRMYGGKFYRLHKSLSDSVDLYLTTDDVLMKAKDFMNKKRPRDKIDRALAKISVHEGAGLFYDSYILQEMTTKINYENDIVVAHSDAKSLSHISLVEDDFIFIDGVLYSRCEEPSFSLSQKNFLASDVNRYGIDFSAPQLTADRRRLPKIESGRIFEKSYWDLQSVSKCRFVKEMEASAEVEIRQRTHLFSDIGFEILDDHAFSSSGAVKRLQFLVRLVAEDLKNVRVFELTPEEAMQLVQLVDLAVKDRFDELDASRACDLLTGLAPLHSDADCIEISNKLVSDWTNKNVEIASIRI